MSDVECKCGFGPGPTCDPRCPAYTEPEPTKIQGSVSLKGRVKSHKPDNATYASFVFDTGNVTPVTLVGKDENRCRVTLIPSGTVGGVYIGRKNAVGSNGGAYIPFNIGPVVLENTDEIWARGDGTNTVTLGVINERYT